MFWEVMFWITAAILVVPFPFKLLAIVSGRDKRPLLVKVEELSNTSLLCIGLWPFWNYVYTVNVPTIPLLWHGWLFVMILWSVIALFKSYKLEHASAQIGCRATLVLSCLSTLLFLPILIAVFSYASSAQV